MFETLISASKWPVLLSSPNCGAEGLDYQECNPTIHAILRAGNDTSSEISYMN